MNQDDLAERISNQFSERGDHGDVWKTLGILLDTDHYLNLGFSPWYLPSVFGSAQYRLAKKISTDLAKISDIRPDSRLLDLGCGRGGPAKLMASRFNAHVTGVDLVPANVRQANDRVLLEEQHRQNVDFLIGDANQLPFKANSFSDCISIDAAPYFPDRGTVFTELSRVVSPDGMLAISDIVINRDHESIEEIGAFTRAWDLAYLDTLERYRKNMDRAGWRVIAVEDITTGSIGRLSKWTRAYRFLSPTVLYEILRRLFDFRGIDLDPLTVRVEQTHPVLPAIKHVVFYAEQKRD